MALPVEICAIRKNLSTFTELPLHGGVTSVNVHCNNIKDFVGLEALPKLQELDASSNRITSLKELCHFKSLRVLNLACNILEDVQGLECLVNLVVLNLSYNNISSLYGFTKIDGSASHLQTIELHGNKISTISEVSLYLNKIYSLRHLILGRDDQHSNPVCFEKGYRIEILSGLPQLTSLDSMDRNNLPVSPAADNVLEMLGLDISLDDMEFTSDDRSCHSIGVPSKQVRSQIKTPNIDAVLGSINKSRLQVTHTSEDLVESIISSMDCQKHTSDNTSSHNSPEKPQVDQEERLKYLEVQLQNLVAARQEKSAITSNSTSKDQESNSETSPHSKPRPKNRIDNQKLKKQTRPANQKASKISKTGRAEPEEKHTYINLVKELENERERRWKSEQAARRLAQLVRDANNEKTEGQSLHDMAARTADRLKQALLREREQTEKVKTELFQCKEQLAEQSDKEVNFRDMMEKQQRTICVLEETTTKERAKFSKTIAMQSKKFHDTEMRLSAAICDMEHHKTINSNLQQRLTELQEILIKKEHEHEKAIEGMFTVDSVEFRNALSRQINLEEKKHREDTKRLQQCIATLKSHYSELEDEFRQALYIEAERFTKVDTQYSRCSGELEKIQASNRKMKEKEEKSRTIISELTSVAKEQKIKIFELAKSKQEILQQYKDRIFNLEISTEDGRKKAVQLELIKQEKSKLVSQLAAIQSVVDGLRDERKLWGHELAQQGASLAQDRGRLESRIETLQQEISSTRKQNERDLDALRIKTKIVDDQTDTIQNMKQGLIDKDHEIAKVQEESISIQRKLEQDVEDLSLNNATLNEKIHALLERKMELKQEIADYEKELTNLKQAHSKLVKKWAEKGQVISKVELQVRQMKEICDKKELKLIKERDEALEAKHLLMGRMERVDVAFREQLEKANASHNEEIRCIARDNEVEMEAMKRKVYSVEEEMREVLRDADRQKKNMEAKFKKVTSVFQDLQDGFTE